MRAFFETELERLHLNTGLQQYAKLSDAEYTELLDILESECAKFPLIPDPVKQESIREFMKTDPEFIGFNRRVIWKWLNIVNRKYLPADQSRYTEDPKHTPAPPEVAEKYLEQWKKDLAKIGQPQMTPQEQIMDHRIALMAEQLRKIECKHSQVEDGVCKDCGQGPEK